MVSVISILVLLISVVPTASAFGAGTARKDLLRDGFGLAGVDGELVRQDSNAAPELWFFRFATDVNDGRGRVAAGTSLELLPSSTLEKMIAETENRLGKGFKLDGRVTKYRGRNFIFPIYFLPLSKTSKPESPSLQEPREQAKEGQPVESPNSVPMKEVPEANLSVESGKRRYKATIGDLDDELHAPQGIIEILNGGQTKALMRRDSKTVKGIPAERARHPAVKRDFVLVDRTGFLCKQDNGGPVFSFDALGRNIQEVSLRLLPCETLERTEQQQSEEVDPVRFKIAGIVTEYKGKHYLLPERAVQAYNHENFGR